MARRNCVPVALLVFALAVTSSAVSTPTPGVKSSLDGITVLPLRLHWTATTEVPPSSVREVDFLIDGTLRWVEHKAPYVYGGDDSGNDLGYLITTFLRSGEHRFTVRAIDSNRAWATDTVTAKVNAAPAPPAALRGVWSRTVTQADKDREKLPPSDGAPVGVWHLVFDSVGVWVVDPHGSGVVEQCAAAPGTIEAFAPIQMAPSSCGPTGCTGGISRFGHTNIGGAVCANAGPFGNYARAVSANHLTLTALSGSCGDRNAIWEGTWTRMSD
jgi:hypothetical protein